MKTFILVLAITVLFGVPLGTIIGFNLMPGFVWDLPKIMVVGTYSFFGFIGGIVLVSVLIQRIRYDRRVKI